ncbi:MAG: ATP-binding protein [Desulfobulbaceae bacterium]|uniref:ATP-binding protein n=1 Tax=Candidatus Desulfatifera sulfidica TaxID=2841691 RepID=A0A8J6NCP1_9BACT|nr:ATP-binding protein [Candidatus Desulfatifera sulfidica]
MKIAIASGKGGTGKTTLATALALAATGPVQYLDCDVEEPNGHLFLRPQLDNSEQCAVIVPQINEELCTYCGQCRDICRFSAITQFGQTVMTFPEMCHSCLGCFRVCEEKAISEQKREIGILESGRAGDILFTHGRMRVGEAMAVPLLNAVKNQAQDDHLVILDAPPGTSCPFVETVLNCDHVLLITEPTPFGLHDMALAATALNNFNIPYGVILNRAGLGDDRVQRWCEEHDVPLLLEIPFDRRIAECYARGGSLLESIPELTHQLRELLDTLQEVNA